MSKINTSNASENPFFQEMINLQKTLDKVSEQLADSLEKIDEFNKRLEEKDKTILQLAEQLSNISAMHFGRSSERRKSCDNKKSEKKNDASDDDSDDQDPGQSVALSKTRTTKKGKNPESKTKPRKKVETIEEQLARLGIVPKPVVEELPEEFRKCSSCGATMQMVGTVHQGYEFEIIPPQIIVKDRQVATYACQECKKKANQKSAALEELNLTPVRAEAKKPLLHKCWATPSLMAFLITLKMQHQIPTNRIREILKDFGSIVPSSATLSEWLIKVAQQYFLPVYNKLKTVLVGKETLCADETTLQVINESVGRRKSKSFLWQFRSVDKDSEPAVLYLYTEGRHGKYAAEFLDGFSGTLLVDGYSGYNRVKSVELAGCWAHCRRYFFQACLCCRSKWMKSMAEKALSMLDQIFDIEDEIREKELSLEDCYAMRQEQTLPIVNRLFDWARSIDLADLASEKMRKAFGYLLNRETALRVFLDDPMLPATNNRCEQGFVSVARGRHNWLFAYSAEGAHALEILFSMVKSAEANQLNVPRYLEYVMNTFRDYDEGHVPDAVIDKVFPWTEEVKQTCLAS